MTSAKKSDTVMYFVALLCGAFAGVVHVAVEDPLLTSLAVLISTMVLGFLRPERPWRWTLLVGLMVPAMMLSANAVGYYETLTRAGLYGSVLIMLPGVAGAFGGFFGRKFIRVIFQGQDQ